MIAHTAIGLFDLVPVRVLAVIAGLLTAVVITPWLIAAQRRERIGQQVYEDAPSSHAKKQGTPTMGGIVFLVAAVVGDAIGGFRASLPLLALVLAAGLIGFLDDLLIVRWHRPLGLRARDKFALVAMVAILYVAWVWQWGLAGPAQTWFANPVTLPLWLWFALAVLAIVGAANAVNLTDGLDGLATGATVPALVGLQLTARFLGLPGGSTIGDAVLGALVGFFWFNRYPARIFMGDTGSLALGALLGGIAVESHALLLLPLFGIVFVVEALSVILQVASFKSTGKRIFKMSPLHHHFELSGWGETAVTSAFIAVATAAASVTWVAWWSTNRAMQ
ncbi:MAG TPA: phospho-N-acetylmuramoyl-pentapeptide-transferase [Candidatus Acidoferrales bacterium]|nr:phospho-N-acetylmuramoyl-pentapeptide-transferase [Candidatus Acidoferrales bacterium]